MGCCGSRRSVWPGDSRASTTDLTDSGTIRLRWRRRINASVTGPGTGTSYQVSAERPVVAVDSRDASGLLATGFFERIG